MSSRVLRIVLIYAVFSAGWILFFHRPVLPFFLWYVAGNGLLIVGWSLEVLAILAIERRSPRLERIYALIAGLGLVSLLLNFAFDGSYNAMNLSISVLLVAIFSIPAYRLTFGRDSSSFTRAVGFFYLLYCLINVVRAIYVVHTDNVSVMVGNLMHSVVFLGLFALLIGVVAAGWAALGSRAARRGPAEQAGPAPLIRRLAAIWLAFLAVGLLLNAAEHFIIDRVE